MSANKAVVVISFGTTFQDTCEKTIAAIERDIQDVFPDRKVYRAWTSGFIRKKILQRDGVKILSPEEALQLAIDEHCEDLLIQSTHLLAGGEYEKIIEAAKPLMSRFTSFHISRPLLEQERDIKEAVGVLSGIFTDVKEDEMAVFMGHGSDSLKIPVYDLLNETFMKMGCENFVTGTVEFDPGIRPVLKMVRERKPKKVYLSPLLVVAGDHATNDMAGDGEDSWKNQISSEGPEVECIMKGLGEYAEIRRMYINHAIEALS